MPIQAELIGRVRDAMTEHGLTQADLSRITGMSTKHINQMLQGHTMATLDAWQQLLDAPGHRPPMVKVCVLCRREGRQRFIYEAHEYRCADWAACRARQRKRGFRPVGPVPTCGRCGRPDSEHGDRPQDGPDYCGWTLAMVQEHRAHN